MQLLMSSLSKLLASILVAVLTGAVLTTIVNQTVMDNHYLEDKLATTNSYARLSTALNYQIGKAASGATGDAATAIDPAITAKLQNILTPTVLQQKINGGLDGLHAYNTGKGPQPTIDLTDLADQVQLAGIPVPENSGLTKPIVLSGSQRTADISKTFGQVRLGAIAAAVLLTLALLVISWERHKWAALPDVAMAVGGLLGLVTMGLLAAAQLASHFLHFNTDAEAFASIGRDLATAIAHDLAIRVGIFAATFLVVGIATRILVARLAANTTVVQMPKTGIKQTYKITN